MGTDLKTRLKKTQLKELQLISAMVVRGEPTKAINSRWEKFVKMAKNELSPSKTGESKVDINEVIQHILSETYLKANNDLQNNAQRLKFLNDMKIQIREELAKTRKTTEDYITSIEERLSTIGEDAQLANIDLQNMLQKQQQTIQMLSNMSKVLHDTALAVIRNMR